MKRIFNSVPGLLNRLQARFRHARPGSVLILVVGLLVVLALMATAMISVTRIDRTTTIQNSANTQIEILMDSVTSLVQSSITNDLLNSTQTEYRPANDSTTPFAFDNYDGINDVYQSWLAARTPVFFNVGLANYVPAWKSFSWPLIRNSAGLYEFSSPHTTETFTIQPQVARTIAYPDPSIDVAGPANSPTNAMNTDKRYYAAVIGSSTSLLSSGRAVPTLQLYNTTPVPGAPVEYPAATLRTLPSGQPATFIAGDADGDGIADCLLTKLPIGQINGVTYYYGQRIIDNNSAINANTAWARDTNFANNEIDAGTAVNKLFFTSNIGLREMLQDYNAASFDSVQMEALNYYRFGNTPTAKGLINNGTEDPVDDNFAQRTDFHFSTQTEALFMQLGRRLGNPGVNFMSAGLPVRYQPLVMPDTSLAYRFCLINPLATPSKLESTLSGSLYDFNKSAAQPYAPSAFRNWFDLNFNWDNTQSTQADPFRRSLRSILVTSNPVTNFVPAHNMTELYTVNQPLSSPTDEKKDDRRFSVVKDIDWPPSEPPTPAPEKAVERMPNYNLSPSQPSKVSLNTASFGELWWGFWNVMCDTPVSTPFGNPLYSAMPPDMYKGMKFLNPVTPSPVAGMAGPPFAAPTDPPTAPAATQLYTDFLPPSTAPLNERHPLYMFRSPLRHPDNKPADTTVAAWQGAVLDAYNVMLLRSAISAANAEALRESMTTPPNEHNILLTAMVGDGTAAARTQVTARVYGTKWQPFITEVYANNDDVTAPTGAANPNGYIAIELWNPYPVDLDISNWELQAVDRTAFPAPTRMTLLKFRAGTVVRTAGPGTPPALVVDNYHVTAANGARYRPQAITHYDDAAPVYYVNDDDGMSGAANHEVVLVRPTTVHPGTESPLIGAPVDSFDFTHFNNQASLDTAAAAAGDTGVVWVRAWHYARPTDVAVVGGWKFVYPGRYDGDQKTAAFATQAMRHQQGTIEEIYRIPTGNISETFDPWNSATKAPAGQHPDPSISLGAANEGSTYPASRAPNGTAEMLQIQLAQDGWAGANKAGLLGNQFPFGGFGRLGDILQVPFFGGYRILNTTTSALIELNSVTVDCAFAEDTDVVDDAVEQVGRFCSLGSMARRWRSSSTYPLKGLVWSGDTGGNDLLYFSLTGSNTNNPPLASPANWQGIADYYNWSTDIFDYFTTVNNPGDDHFPNVRYDLYPPGKVVPANTALVPSGVNNTDSTKMPSVTYGRVVAGSTSSITGTFNLSNVDTFYNGAKVLICTGAAAGQTAIIDKVGLPFPSYTGSIRTMAFDTVTPTAPKLTTTPAAGDWFKIYPVSPSAEDTVGVHGLININTAPWYVIAQLPLLPLGPDGGIDSKSGVPTYTQSLAKEIVYYRDVDDGKLANLASGAKLHPHGPFKNIFELNQVINHVAGQPFQDGWGQMAGDPDGLWGDDSPFGGPDLVANDFESLYIMVNRLSNLVTTRSDSYTAYVVLQGWRGAGTPQAEMVAERRAVQIIDRSPVTGATAAKKAALKVQTVPAD